MSQRDSDTTNVEDSSPEIGLTDPDNYHRQQRLKEIHQARQRVHKKMDGFDYPDKKPEAKKQREALAYAVSMYVSELETIIVSTGAEVELPERYPWKDALSFADALGVIPKDYDHDTMYSPKQNSIEVFRICNRVLADVKPLIEETEDTEWEV